MVYPTVATVFVDGREAGDTPYTNPAISTGSHKIMVRKQLYHDYQETATITKDRKCVISAILQPAFGFLEVSSTPPGADVEVLDSTGTRRGSGTTTLPSMKLLSGSYTIRVSKIRYYNESRNIGISDGQKRVESFQLRPSVRHFSSGKYPHRGKRVDNGSKKRNDALDVGVGFGRYMLELQKDLYMAWSGEAEIRDAETTRVSQQLTPIFGKLDVTVTPKGSQVLVDDRLVGQTQ